MEADPTPRSYFNACRETTRCSQRDSGRCHDYYFGRAVPPAKIRYPTAPDPEKGTCSRRFLPGWRVSIRFRPNCDSRQEFSGRSGRVGAITSRSARGPVPKSRLELRSALSGVENRLVQVCDGKDIWIHDGIENADRVVRIDAVRCHETVKATGAVPSIGSLGVGGMPGLLRSLESVFYFEEAPQKGIGPLGVQRVEGTLRRSTALAFSGRT